MSYKNFSEFFEKATECGDEPCKPYPYQIKLAEQEGIPEILNIPTGGGKTEAAILAIYLWRRKYAEQKVRKDTPRRLIYCLPMRVLVEQTVKKVEKWINNLEMQDDIKIITMMGGNIDRYYKMYPENEVIIIGTQDMLLSRALNRGYGTNMFQWPIEFGLLNNDCLWIMDEIQLMHNGLVTSVQLQAFRESMKTYASHKTVWMSATINPQWLDTIDHNSNNCRQFKTTKEDLENKEFSQRMKAQKKLRQLELPTHKDTYTKKDAKIIKAKHENETITLVIVNTVKRAQSLFDELKKTADELKILLIHSRFRSSERKKINETIMNISESKNTQNMIIVSTQVIEAGVDISAKTIITEMAPWPSMIQRFGRCNRKGRDNDASVYVIKLGEKYFTPYEKEDMKKSEQRIDNMMNRSISPQVLPTINDALIHETVIRKSDIIGLFDTIPDMSGSHTDVSRFVRSLEDAKDVSVFWKSWDGNNPKEKYKTDNTEMCSVSISDMKEFLKGGKKKAWRYDYLDGGWIREFNPYPGQILLLRQEDGGYTEERGWDTKSNEEVVSTTHELEHATKPTSETEKMEEESHESDTISESSEWITLNDHTTHVIKETEKIFKKLDHLSGLKESITTAAEYHDVGKAHKIFQNTMLKNTKEKDVSRKEFWAKRKGNIRHGRKNFRHEAASALAFLKLHPTHPEVDLITYLIAAHHGKVRLSMRTLPKKKGSKYVNPDATFLLGIPMNYEENLPIFLSAKYSKSKESKEEVLTDNNIKADVKISTNIARIGNSGEQRSWLQITLSLLKKYGPFRLAYLEAIIRAADSRASMKERQE